MAHCSNVCRAVAAAVATAVVGEYYAQCVFGLGSNKAIRFSLALALALSITITITISSTGVALKYIALFAFSDKK